MTSTPYLIVVRDRVEDRADDYAGPDTPAANPSYQDRAETCARSADQLAGRAEHAARRTDDVLDALQAGDVLRATRYAIRTRAEKRGDSIPGMATEGRFVTFDRVQLAEWWSQRPGSGRKAG